MAFAMLERVVGDQHAGPRERVPVPLRGGVPIKRVSIASSCSR